MIVAGEASGDLHGAKLVKALQDLSPNTKIEFFGCAGPRMREAGVFPIIKADELSIVGVPEIISALPVFLRAFVHLKRAAAEKRADVVILIDFPEFNLKLARALKRSGHTGVYYISPQLWAWRKYRLRTIRKYVDLLITILPFEKAWYASRGIKHVEYVGNPLVSEVYTTLDKAEFCRKHGLDTSKPIISLLPGSRQKEISRILPVMLDAAAHIAIVRLGAQFIVAAASQTAASEVKRIIESRDPAALSLPATLIVTENETYDALNASDTAAVTSGTATLETGIIGTPMAIVYRGSALNYALLRPLIDVEHFGLINLIAGTRIATELIQNDFTPEALARELLRLLEPEENRKMRVKLKTAAAMLGHGGASKRAAESIINLLAETS